MMLCPTCRTKITFARATETHSLRKRDHLGEPVVGTEDNMVWLF